MSANDTNAQEGIDYKDKQALQELYWGDGLSTTEIADAAGVTSKTIWYWLDKHGIDIRDQKSATKQHHRVEYAYFQTDSAGYEKWNSKWDQTVDTGRVHRLLAVAKFGFQAVSGTDVHHIDGIPWNNQHENITLEEPSNHRRLHNLGEKNNQSKLSESDVKEIKNRLGGEETYKEIARDYPVGKFTIGSIQRGELWDWV